MSTHDEAVDETREKLEPDDVVGNALCDQLLELPDPSLVRVVNYHGDWCEAAPDWQDFRRAIDRCGDDVAARWPSESIYGNDIVVRAAKVVGTYDRAVSRAAPTHGPKTVSGDIFERLCSVRGPPELVPLADVEPLFAGGEA